jgi:hypothetical protein
MQQQLQLQKQEPSMFFAAEQTSKRSVSPDLDAVTSSSSSSSSSSSTPAAAKTKTKAQHQQQQQQQQHHITVVHNYHDHANDNEADYQDDRPVRGGVTTPFPLKLHDMLVATAAEGMDDIVSWQPHGRCFLVHKPKEFVNLLPRFFKLSKLASFQRQLNLYGFQRLTRGRDRSGYYHELFLRDRTFLSCDIQRVKVKGTGVRARSNPDQEPDFWKNLPWVASSSLVSSCSSSTDQQSSRLQLPFSLPAPTTMPPAFFTLQSSSSIKQQQEDLLDAFEKPFHYLDPFQPSAGSWTMNNVDELLETEADTFFQDFDFDESAIDAAGDIEDDQVFGDLLEQMIA